MRHDGYFAATDRLRQAYYNAYCFAAVAVNNAEEEETSYNVRAMLAFMREIEVAGGLRLTAAESERFRTAVLCAPPGEHTQLLECVDRYIQSQQRDINNCIARARQN